MEIWAIVQESSDSSKKFQIQYLSLTVTPGPSIKPLNHQLFQKVEKALQNLELYFEKT